MHDEQLRAQLADWARADDRLTVPDIADLRGRVRRRRLRVGSAVAGLAVVTAAITVAATLPTAPAGPLVSGPVAWYPAGPLPAADAEPEAAPYYVALENWNGSPGYVYATVAVIDWKTGTPITIVRPPTPGGSYFVGVAAAGDDRTFVLEEDGSNRKPIAFYELRLQPDGRPLPLIRLAIPASTMAGAGSAALPNPLIDPVQTAGIPPVGLSNSFAISPDGRQLAVAVAVGHRAAIDVVSLATGSVREWSAAGGASVASGMQVGWAGNRYVAFTWWTSASVRLLDTASGSNLLESRVVAVPLKNVDGIGAGTLFHFTISPDGSTLFAEYVGAVKEAIIQISVRTGDPVREILPPVTHGVRGPFCQVLWSDPSGRSVAATCGSVHESPFRLEQGIISDGRFRETQFHLPDNLVIDYGPGNFVAW